MIANFTKNYIEKKYELGKLDCFRLVYDYLKGKIELPTEFNGITLKTYADLFIKKPNIARKLMVSFLEKYLIEIKSHEISAGDIVVLNYNHSPIFFGIVVANANVFLISDKEGAITVPLKYYQIKRVFRCQQ